MSDTAVAEPTSEITANPNGEFSVVLVREGVPTIDGRFLQPGSMKWRELPLPLMFTTINSPDGGHKGSRVGGAIDDIQRMDDGSIVALGHFASTEDGQELRTLISEGVLTGVSADIGGAEREVELAEDGSQQESVTNGIIIGCTVLPFPAFGTTEGTATRIAVTAAADVLESTIPHEWFDRSELHNDVRPLTVTPEGRVFGYAATWGTCHIGMPGCTTAPKSATNYAHFATKQIITDGGPVPVGTITLGTGHAGLQLGHRSAAEHYDNTGTAVADVAIGEDENGIWIAGAVRPGLDENRIAEFARSSVSGDWRSIRGNLEMVGLLAVNVPGFPVQRTRMGFAAEEQMSLVAAGVLPPVEAKSELAIVMESLSSLRASVDSIAEFAKKTVAPAETPEEVEETEVDDVVENTDDPSVTDDPGATGEEAVVAAADEEEDPAETERLKRMTAARRTVGFGSIESISLAMRKQGAALKKKRKKCGPAGDPTDAASGDMGGGEEMASEDTEEFKKKAPKPDPAEEAAESPEEETAEGNDEAGEEEAPPKKKLSGLAAWKAKQALKADASRGADGKFDSNPRVVTAMVKQFRKSTGFSHLDGPRDSFACMAAEWIVGLPQERRVEALGYLNQLAERTCSNCSIDFAEFLDDALQFSLDVPEAAETVADLLLDCAESLDSVVSA